MTKLTITVDVPDEIDPRTTDPWEIAESIVDAHDEVAAANGQVRVTFVEAEWA